ncbi:unnamed protein product [Heterobilharzia americana]|nr:unnamed protein product [Heterobilharzia americana]
MYQASNNREHRRIKTIILSLLYRVMRPKRVIIFGLIFEAIQLTLYGFTTNPVLLWSAGLIAAMGSITYPALSAFISNHAAADQQGVAQGLVTGIRGLCGGLGPALFGLFFYIFKVDLNEHTSGTQINNKDPSKSLVLPSSVQTLQELLMPGPPFAFGAALVLLAILVSMFIPENSLPSQSSHSEVISEPSHDSTVGGIFGETRLRRSSPSGQSNRAVSNFQLLTPGIDDNDSSKLMSSVEMYKYSGKGEFLHGNNFESDGVSGIWDRLMTSLSDFRNPVYVKQKPSRVYRQSKVRFSPSGIVEPFRRLFIRRTPYALGSGGIGGGGGVGGLVDHESRLHYSKLPFTVIPSNTLNDMSNNELLFANPLLLNRCESEEAADLSNYRAHHFRRIFTASTTANSDVSGVINPSEEYSPVFIPGYDEDVINSEEKHKLLKSTSISSISPSGKSCKQKFFNTNHLYDKSSFVSDRNT